MFTCTQFCQMIDTNVAKSPCSLCNQIFIRYCILLESRSLAVLTGNLDIHMCRKMILCRFSLRMQPHSTLQTNWNPIPSLTSRTIKTNQRRTNQFLITAKTLCSVHKPHPIMYCTVVYECIMPIESRGLLTLFLSACLEVRLLLESSNKSRTVSD